MTSHERVSWLTCGVHPSARWRCPGAPPCRADLRAAQRVAEMGLLQLDAAAGAPPPPSLLLPLPVSLLYTPSVDNRLDSPPPTSLLLPLPVSLLYTPSLPPSLPRSGYCGPLRPLRPAARARRCAPAAAPTAFVARSAAAPHASRWSHSRCTSARAAAVTQARRRGRAARGRGRAARRGGAGAPPPLVLSGHAASLTPY